MTDTIYALSSAPGKAGVAVVRVSGPEAWVSFKLLTNDAEDPSPRAALFRTLVHPVSGVLIDKALVLPFKGPASFTGEDVVEYHLHGSTAVIAAFLAALREIPRHRLAEPGEYTRRAFENEKLDLTEAEAVADLINADRGSADTSLVSNERGAFKTLQRMA
jgi:tRNA modification GTPase